MPRVNIYIRNEDYDKWKAIEDKPEWLHRTLADGDFDYETAKKTLKDLSGTPEQFKGSAPKIIKTPKQAKEAVENTGFISKSYSARKAK